MQSLRRISASFQAVTCNGKRTVSWVTVSQTYHQAAIYHVRREALFIPIDRFPLVFWQPFMDFMSTTISKVIFQYIPNALLLDHI